MRAILAWVACLGLAASAWAAGAAAMAPPRGSSATAGDAAFAQAFVCPDPAAPPPDRKAELTRFMDWVRAHHGNWTLDQAIAFRFQLLETHHCAATLQAIRSNNAAAAARRARTLTASAEAGNATAQEELGQMYFSGRGVPRDLAQAFAWSHKAAVQGNVAAEARVCFAYATGHGVVRDDGKALKWCRQAAAGGSAPAEYGLALMHERGDGVPRNAARAAAWYRKAAAQGFAPAEFNLGTMYLHGEGVPQDAAEGVALYRRAAARGWAGAEGNLGYLYMTGTGGLPRDYAKALKWSTLAANRGNASAQNSLGVMYSTGEGVARDDVTAAKWFMLVRGGGEVAAACNLGKVEARMTPSQVAAARDAALAWQADRGIADGTTNAPLQPSACPSTGSTFGTAAFVSERAGRDAAAHMLNAEFGKVPIAEVAARGYAPDTPVAPNQARDWTHGVEAYLSLRGYRGFAATVGASGSAEFNAFLDAVTNVEGNTSMGSSSYANLAAAHPAAARGGGILPLPQTVALPQTATITAWSGHTRFRVASGTPADMQGASTDGAPTFAVTLADGMGGWQEGFPAALPDAAADPPAALRGQVAWFLVNGEWLAVPRGWRLQDALNAATPTWAATFVAPGGAADGWLAVGGAGPGVSEAFSGAEGYFPGVYQLYDQVLPGAFTRDPVLVPAPDSLAHPAPCVAVVRYTSSGLVVVGVKVFQTPTGSIDLSPYVRSYFLALPPADAALAGALAAAFQQQHPVAACRMRQTVATPGNAAG